MDITDNVYLVYEQNISYILAWIKSYITGYDGITQSTEECIKIEIDIEKPWISLDEYYFRGNNSLLLD